MLFFYWVFFSLQYFSISVSFIKYVSQNSSNSFSVECRYLLFAVSSFSAWSINVSKSLFILQSLSNVYYIANQEEHHKKTTFLQEYNKFIDTYGFDIIKNNLG